MNCPHCGMPVSEEVPPKKEKQTFRIRDDEWFYLSFPPYYPIYSLDDPIGLPLPDRKSVV